MEKRTNKDLYNHIMESVSKEVKRILNEETDSKVSTAASKLISDLKKNKKELEVAIGLMKIMCCSSLSVTDYSDERFKKQKYMGVPYSELIPELERRLKQQNLECNGSKPVETNINES